MLRTEFYIRCPGMVEAGEILPTFSWSLLTSWYSHMLMAVVEKFRLIVFTRKEYCWRKLDKENFHVKLGNIDSKAEIHMESRILRGRMVYEPIWLVVTMKWNLLTLLYHLVRRLVFDQVEDIPIIYSRFTRS